MLKLHDKTGMEFLYYWAYNLWQKTAFKAAKELDAKEKFDLFHQFNMIGFREPGYLWKMNKPFIWGPVGGTVNVDLKFYKLLGLRGSLKNMLRNTANFFQLRFSGKVNSAGNKSSLIIAASSSEKNNLAKHFPGKRIVVINETGTNFAFESKTINTDKPLSILWSGTHTPGKALPLLLEALKELKDKIDFKLIILGRGKETGRWQQLAEKNGVANKIKWVGYVDRSVALEMMKETDITVFTSLKEGTSYVVLESLSLGMPVICLDICGMADVVTQACGIKIPVHNMTQMVRGFADAVQEINNDRKLLANLSTGALARATQYNWNNKALEIADAYASVVAPEF